MSYAEELKHPLWQQRRLRVFERAGFQCERCESDDRQLHAHHKVYLRGRKVWEYPEQLLECLCDTCHSRAHVEKEQFELLMAQHPTAVLPYMTKMLGKVAAAFVADDPSAKVHALNDVRDELDAMEDYLRGQGGSVHYIARCSCAKLKAVMSPAKWLDQTFFENGHVSDCPLGEVMNEQAA